MGLLERSISESSDDIDIRPLEFGDLKRGLSESYENIYDDVSHNEETNLFFSAAMDIKKKKYLKSKCQKQTSLVKIAWKNAARKALSIEDPWREFHLNKYKTEKARRHRYHALKQCWVVDEVLIKMENDSFNHGAMRECFRIKKLSNFAKCDDWSSAHNYVAKRYLDSNVKRQTYFDEVTLQMDAKLWGEEFNRHNPPKKIDIFQMSILELFSREESPLYHVEHFIEGNYVKYNSNSGFVLSEAMRMTPQAFSHFTFERSGHEMIVVDIQGVGDLYTDPQIHTATGSEYGDGNLGTRGMALFFQSHLCNSICHSLGLSQFDLFITETDNCLNRVNSQSSSQTKVRCTEEPVRLPNEEERENIHNFLCRQISSENEWKNFDDLVRKKSRPSHILSGQEHRMLIDALMQDNITETEETVLGQIHLDLANYHEINRFVQENETYDREAAMFHLNYAAKCGTLAAIIAMAQIHSGIAHDILPDIQLDEESRDSSKAFEYLFRGAKCEDRASMIKIAKMFETGLGLPSHKSVDWKEAVYWYETATQMDQRDKSGNFDGTMDNPVHQLVARQAALYVQGGHGLQQDSDAAGELFTKAADLATEAMNGKLASKYYMQAEDAWAQCEE